MTCQPYCYDATFTTTHLTLAPLAAEERAEIAARHLNVLEDWAGKPLERGVMRREYALALIDVPRLLSAERYERERADAAEKRAVRLADALQAVWEDWQISPEQWADSNVGPGTVAAEPRNPPAAEETIEIVRAALAEEPKL